MEEYMLEHNISSKLGISALVNNVLHMLKNPVIDGDLISVLDTFMKKISELDECDTNSYKILNFKFVEVAIFLQSAADLYSKKVDLLWDVIFDYQKRLLISTEKIEEKNQELQKIEERKHKYKRKRKSNVYEDVNEELSNNLSFGNLEDIDYFSKECEPFDCSNEWVKFKLKTFSDNVLHENKNFAFSPYDAIYNDSEDYIGRYDQFHSRFIFDDIFYLENQNLLADDHNWIIKMKIDTYVVNDFLLEKSIPVNTSSKSYSSELQDYVNNFLEVHKRSKCDMMCSDYVVKQSYVHLERLPFNVMRDKLRRTSTADSLLDDDLIESCRSPSNCNVNDELQATRINDTFSTVNNTLENRSKSCSQDSAFFEDVDECNTTEDSETEVLLTLHSEKETSNFLANECNNRAASEIVIENETLNDNSNTEAKVLDVTQSVEQSNLLQLEETFSDNLKEEKRKRIKKQWPSFLSVEDRNSRSEEIKKKKKCKSLSSVTLNKLVTGVTAQNEDYERFCLLNYRLEEGEGSKLMNINDEHYETNVSEFDANSPIPDETDTSESEDCNEICHSPECDYEDLNSSVLHTSSPVPPEPDSNVATDEQTAQNFTSSDTQMQENASTFLSDTNVEQEILRKNIRNWQSFIVPKLKTLENRADFNIHEYGLNLIESTTLGEEKYFKDLMKGKNSAEVTRFFIAVLQLANTYNVEIKGNVPGEISNETFQFKVLNKSKHYELLESYQAPSERRFQDFTQSHSNLASIPSTSICGKDPPRKKLKSLSNYNTS